MQNKVIEWDYNFSNEKDKIHVEQSDLSRRIFMKLFEIGNSSYKCEMQDGISIRIVSKNKRVDFLFDVMHNPKKNKQPYNQAKLKGIEVLSFEKNYHSIGNFAPVPRTIISKWFGPNLQFLHYCLNEIWPWFLKYMQDNWSEWPTKIHEFISFKEYMKYSCQQLYYKQIFEDFYFNTNMTDLNEINWKDKVIEWNEKMDKDGFDNKLISFNELFDEKNIEEIDKQICFLIEARGRCIVSIIEDYKPEVKYEL